MNKNYKYDYYVFYKNAIVLKINLLIILLLCIASINGVSQLSPVGVWQTVDDKEGDTTSHIEIYEVEGKIHGKILRIVGEQTIFTCDKCKGDKKDQPIIGMEILWGMKKDKENEWKGGKIMDPENGKEYKCKIKLPDPDILEVRGYMGISLLGRTQKWYRLKED